MSKPFLLENGTGISLRLHDYAQLTKLRLSSLVVFSAAMAFVMAPGPLNWGGLIALVLGGFLVTGAANGFNQVIERELDRKMNRTAARPLAEGRMPVNEAIALCLATGIAGVFILSYFMNVYSGMLGLLSILLYTLVYTPMKRISPFAVFIGAIPGAIPPLLGWVAATGSFGFEGWMLFSIQFMWQFPHFWAIAWVMDDDYKKAGFRLLPTGERDKGSALQTVLYSLALIPVGLMPFAMGVTGLWSAIVVTLASVYMFQRAWLLYRRLEMKEAKALMMASFIYLPLVQIALAINTL